MDSSLAISKVSAKFVYALEKVKPILEDFLNAKMAGDIDSKKFILKYLLIFVGK